MKNYIQEGKRITWTNGTGTAVASGDLVVIGLRVGVASVDIADGASGAVAMEGVFEVPKEAALVVAQGDLLYCDATSGELDKTDAAQTLAGYAFAAAAGAASVVMVKLNA
jgi:predicted RecA/RadA family phage recombinase